MDEGTRALLKQRRSHKRSELIRKYRWLIPVCLWLLAFSLLWRFNVSGAFVMESDALGEYKIYSKVIQTGTASSVLGQGNLGSAVMTTVLPAILQRVTGIDPLFLFRWYTLLIFPFLPVVLWFVFRRLVGNWGGMLASVVIISQPHFLWSPSMARVTMALLFVAVIMLLLILSRPRWWRYPLIAIAGILVILSHYGTTFALVIILTEVTTVWAIWSLVRRKWNFTYMKMILFLLCVVALSSFIWHGMVFSEPLSCGKSMVSNVVKPPDTYPKVEISPQSDVKAPYVPTEDRDRVSFFALESREAVVQVALGRTWGYMNLAQRIEFVLSWLIILAITYGVIKIVRRRDYRIETKAAACIAYGICLAGVIYPIISVDYGIARVYYFAALILSPCLIVGLTSVSRKIRVSPVVVCTVMVFGHLLATTGILHNFMGLVR